MKKGKSQAQRMKMRAQSAELEIAGKNDALLNTSPHCWLDGLEALAWCLLVSATHTATTLGGVPSVLLFLLVTRHPVRTYDPPQIIIPLIGQFFRTYKPIFPRIASLTWKYYASDKCPMAIICNINTSKYIDSTSPGWYTSWFQMKATSHLRAMKPWVHWKSQRRAYPRDRINKENTSVKLVLACELSSWYMGIVRFTWRGVVA